VARVRRTPEEARTLILASARELIAEKGPDAVGLKDVAVRAGVSHALVTHYFGTYEALVEATLADEVRRARESLLARVQSSTPSDLEGWIELFLSSLRTSQYGRLAAWALLTGRARHADFFPRREKGMKQVADAIEARVRDLEGDVSFTRAELERSMVLVLSAGIGYVLGGDVFWASLGLQATGQRDAAFRDYLATLLRRDLLEARGSPAKSPRPRRR
jgi:AcrR family transcriptional regulator